MEALKANGVKKQAPEKEFINECAAAVRVTHLLQLHQQLARLQPEPRGSSALSPQSGRLLINSSSKS